MTPPLKGLRLIELGQYVAVPGAVALLGNLGADVIKVEPVAGEAARHIGPTGAAVLAAYNRGKRSLAINLSDRRCQDALRSIVMGSHAVIENMRPGTARRLGLDGNTLRSASPHLVHASLSGFSLDGPNRDRPGLDIAAQAESGMMSITGEPGSPPQRVGFPVVDAAATHALATAVLAALFRQFRSGEGELIQLTLTDVAVQLQAVNFLDYLIGGVEPTRSSSGQPTAAPAADLIPTSDGHVVLSAYLDDHWTRFCAVVGRPELADDPRFQDNASRVRNRRAMLAAIEPTLAGRTTDECVAWLSAEGIVVGAVRSYSQVVQSDEMTSSGILGTDERGDPFVGSPYRLGGNRAVGGKVPASGEHTREILVELAGLSDEDVSALVRDGVAFEAAI